MIKTLNHLPHPHENAAALAGHFTDLAPPLNDRQAHLEASRCLYCYDAPCVNACPSEIDIPSFIRNIHQENVQGAAQKILSANILGGSCARVCPTEILCQQACVRNNAHECAPVLIGLLQRYAVDNAHFSEHPFQRAAATGKRIAVVGAGPAGLSCAHRSAMHGHDVVIFEAREKAGGLNEYGIAKYKLVDDYAQKELEFLLEIGGIEIRHGQKLGENLTLSDLHQQFDAVFLGLGLAASKQLGLAHEDAPGLLAATDYIRELRQADDLTPTAPGRPLHRPRRRQHRHRHGRANGSPRRSRRQPGVPPRRRGHGRHRPRTGHRQGQSSALADLGTTAKKCCSMIKAKCAACASLAPGWWKVACKPLAKPSNWPPMRSSKPSARPSTAAPSPIRWPVNSSVRASESKWTNNLRTSIPGVYAGGDCTSLDQDLTVQAVQHGKRAAEAINAQLMLNVEAA